ncbi:MAG: GLPGLI family protein [Prevotellaceae bacterium]|jgi:GLPGLI family protein|nr:GLPGLI family protein [Prevotellaceae bacterium]
MKKLFLLSILLFSFTIQIAAQFRDISKKMVIDDCKYSIIYTHTFVRDTIKKNPHYDKQVLEIGDSLSHFYSIYADKVDSVWYNFSNNTKAHKPNKSGADGINPFKEAGLKDNESPTHENYFMNYPKKGTLMVSTEIHSQEFIYEEPIQKFEWKFTTDTATILGYKCMKTTTTFRGRNYEVWFTPFIPIRRGMWKFNGLPGLILKATDTKGYFKWEAIGIEKPENRKIYAYIFDKLEMQKITRKDMIKLLHKRWQDPIGLSFLMNEKLQVSGYIDATTGKRVLVKRGDTYNHQFSYIPIPELE